MGRTFFFILTSTLISVFLHLLQFYSYNKINNKHCPNKLKMSYKQLKAQTTKNIIFWIERR